MPNMWSFFSGVYILIICGGGGGGFMGSNVLSICRCSLVLYSVGSRDLVSRLLFSMLSMRLLFFVHVYNCCRYGLTWQTETMNSRKSNLYNNVTYPLYDCSMPQCSIV